MRRFTKAVSLRREILPKSRTSYSTKVDGSLQQNIQYPFWFPVGFFQRHMPRVWNNVNYYYSQMYIEHQLNIQAQLQERLNSQRRELDTMAGLIQYLQHQYERLLREELHQSKDLSVASIAGDQNASLLLVSANKHTKQHLTEVQANIQDYIKRRDEIALRHQRENIEYEQFLKAGLPQAQLWMLLQSIYPSYYLFFFLLGIVVWVINLVRGNMVKRSIKQKLTKLQETFGRQFTPFTETVKLLGCELQFVKADLIAVVAASEALQQQQQQQQVESLTETTSTSHQPTLNTNSSSSSSSTQRSNRKRSSSSGNIVIDYCIQVGRLASSTVHSYVNPVVNWDVLYSSQQLWANSVLLNPKVIAWGQFSASVVLSVLLLFCKV